MAIDLSWFKSKKEEKIINWLNKKGIQDVLVIPLSRGRSVYMSDVIKQYMDEHQETIEIIRNGKLHTIAD